VLDFSTVAMKYFAVLFLVGLAVAAPQFDDKFLDKHVPKFLTIKRTTTDKDDAYDNFDTVELVRSFGFCVRKLSLVGLDTVGSCMQNAWKEGKTTPKLMASLAQKTMEKAGGSVDIEVSITDDGTVTRNAEDLTWTAKGTITIGKLSIPYDRKGLLHLGKGSVTFSEEATATGANYKFGGVSSVHLDFAGSKQQSGVVLAEGIISVSQASGVEITAADGSKTEAEHMGQGTVHVHTEAVKKDNVIHVLSQATVSALNGDAVHVHKADGTVTHVHSSTSSGLDVEEGLNITLSSTGVSISAAGLFLGRSAHVADAPDYRYAVEGGARKTLDITSASGKISVTGHEDLVAKADVRDYQEHALAGVEAQGTNDITATITGDQTAKTGDLEASGKFSGKVVITPAGSSSATTVTETGSGTVSITTKDNGDNTASVHIVEDMKIHIDVE